MPAMKASVWQRSRCRVLLSVLMSSDTATKVWRTSPHTACSDALPDSNLAKAAGGRSGPSMRTPAGDGNPLWAASVLTSAVLQI